MTRSRFSLITVAAALLIGVSAALAQELPEPTFPITYGDTISDPQQCEVAAPADAAAGTFPDGYLIEVEQTADGDRITAHFGTSQPQEFDYNIRQFGITVSEDGTTSEDYLVVMQMENILFQGLVDPSNLGGPPVAGSEEQITLNEDQTRLTLTVPYHVGWLGVVSGSVSICDRFPNNLIPQTLETYAPVQPLLTPQEIDSLLAQSERVARIADEGTATISQRTYDMAANSECLAAPGSSTPPTLEGTITITTANDGSGGSVLSTSIDSSGQASLDAYGDTVLWVINAFDSAHALIGAYLVGYEDGALFSAPIREDGTGSRSQQGTRDDSTRINMTIAEPSEAVIVEPTFNPSSPPPFFNPGTPCPNTEVM